MSHKGCSHIRLAARDMDRTRHFSAHIPGCKVVRRVMRKLTAGGQLRPIFADDVTMQVRVERSIASMRQRWDRLREAANHAGAYA